MSIRVRLSRAPGPTCEPLERRTLFAGGDADATFGSGGHASLNFPGATFEAKSVALRDDGKTVIAGTKGGRLAVVRLNADGSLDAGFGGGGLFESGVATRATDVAIQPGDGKIVVTAIAPRTGGGPDPNRFTTVRILPDGEGLDPAFDGDGVVSRRYGDDGLGGYCYANAVAVQRDGKIVVGGVANFDNITYFSNDFVVARYNPDGSPDATFGTRPLGVPLTYNSAAMGGDDEILDLAIDYNGDPASNPLYGSIVAVGDTDNHWAAGWVPQSSRFAVARFRPDGRLDGSLDGDGKLTISFPPTQTAWAAGVLIQPGGKIVATGSAGPNGGPRDAALVRFLPNGDPDATFGPFETGQTMIDVGGDDLASGAAQSFLGGVLAAGSTGVAAFMVDGMPDPRFSQNGLLEGVGAAGGIATTGSAIFPARSVVLADGNRVHRYVDAGENPVAIGTFDPDGGSESGPEEAHFLVTRPVRMPTPLRVYLNVSGTAAPPYVLGGDYTANGFTVQQPFRGPSYVDIPANQTFVSVSIVPSDDGLVEGDETAIFSIAPDPAYDIGTNGSVVLEVHDNDATTLYAIADAHVRDGALAGENFGAASLLETELAPAGTGETRETYVKFDISSLNPARLGNVTLRMFGRLSTGGPPLQTSVFGVSASGWQERAITFNNRPPAVTTALGTVSVNSAAEAGYDFDVTAFVRRELAAGRTVGTLLLRNAETGDAHTLWSPRHSEYSDPRLVVTDNALAPASPRVTQVFAGSTSWGTAFRQSLEDSGLGDSVWGYAVGDGAAQLNSLPWDKVDRISVRFNKGVDVALGNLSVRGARGGEYQLADAFEYDDVNNVATWTLSAPLGRGLGAPGVGDVVLLDLDADSETSGVSSRVGRVVWYLDGDWANGSDAYDSGDGSPGGDFRFQVNVLPGDVDGNGTVNGSDLVALRTRLLRRASDPFSGASHAYAPRYDLNGDGRVSAQDMATLRAALFTRLPPTVPAAAVAQSLAVRRTRADAGALWDEVYDRGQLG